MNQKNQKELIKKVNTMKWEHWLYRNFPPFSGHIIASGALPSEYERMGYPAKGVEGFIYDSNNWWRCMPVYDASADWVDEYLQKHTVFETTKAIQKHYDKYKNRIKEIAADTSSDPIEQFREVCDILRPICVWIWICHQFEVWIKKEVKKQIPPFLKKGEDLDLYVGDISLPTKKNHHELMADALIAGQDPKEVHKEYGWIKARGRSGFAKGYTLEEVKQMQKDLQKKKSHKLKPKKVPAELEELQKQLQELVWFRLFRTDIAYEFVYNSHPLFERVAKARGIEKVEDYLYTDILDTTKEPKKYDPNNYAVLKEGTTLLIVDHAVLEHDEVKDTELKGVTAMRGKATGTAKIVMNVNDMHKVKKGDILVTPMTIAPYVPAMERSAAFVTDEGGITCHAAILSREMSKPCIIGTKKATSAFKDGDVLEVDADASIVKKIR